MLMVGPFLSRLQEVRLQARETKASCSSVHRLSERQGA